MNMGVIVCLYLQVADMSGLQVIKQGAVHKLVFVNVQDEHGGKYTFSAKGAESEAVLRVAGDKNSAKYLRFILCLRFKHDQCL